MEDMTTGVEESAAAEQTQTQEVTQEQTQQTQENTGVETQSAAGTNEGVEKAFAARLKEATEKARQEAAQEARDAVIAGMGWEWNGKPITSEAEYKQALKEKELVDKLKAQYADPPEELVNELLEGRRFREQYTAKEKEMQESQKKAQEEKDLISRRDAMYDEFYAEFPDYNTEEKWRTIPKEVWIDADKWLKSGGREGRRLSDALTRHNLKQMQTQQQTAQANAHNADTSTGSAKNNENISGFISKEEFDANKGNRDWVRKNLSTIEESRKSW